MSNANGNGKRAKGVVLWFNPAKGFGYIMAESGEEVFVHHTHITMRGYRKVRNGQRVEFDLVKSRMGNRANDVVIISDGK